MFAGLEPQKLPERRLETRQIQDGQGNLVRSKVWLTKIPDPGTNFWKNIRISCTIHVIFISNNQYSNPLRIRLCPQYVRVFMSPEPSFKRLPRIAMRINNNGIKSMRC